MEDVRVGRRTECRQAVVSVANVDVLLVPANANRIALVIAPLATFDVRLSFGTAASATVGIRIPAGAPPIALDVQRHGQLVMGEIHAFGPAVAESITFWEVLLKEM